MKLFYLFDLFRTRNLVALQILACPVGHLCLSSPSPSKEKKFDIILLPASMVSSKNVRKQWLMLPMMMIMSAQSLAVDPRLLIDFNPNQPKKTNFILSSLWTLLQIGKLLLRNHLPQKIWRSVMNHPQQRPFLLTLHS